MNVPKDWIYNTNIYEVNLRQYTREGTFNAFAQHLPRLKDMGVKTLWFMPITPISKKEMKGTMGSYYACSDYTAINPEFGTMQDFKNLVDYAHKLELKVIIDWVANHTGWDHVWTNTHPEWYERDPNGEFKRASGMDDIIELDFSNKDMRQAMIEAMKFWVRKCGIDGFRCDLAFWVELDFWVEAIPQLNELKPLFWFAEADPLQYPQYMQVFDAAYAWIWMHKTEEWYQKKLHLNELRATLDNYENVPGLRAWFTSNHDENSWNGSEYEKYGDAAKALAVHSCTWPGIPLIYSGQELPNKTRLKFFDKDVIQWKKHCELHDFYATILQLHYNNPALNARSDLFQLHTNTDASVLSYLRKKDEHEVIVFLNLSDHTVRFELLDKWISGKFSEVFLHQENDFSVNRSFEIKAWQWLVWVKEQASI
jgi:alpha-amylase